MFLFSTNNIICFVWEMKKIILITCKVNVVALNLDPTQKCSWPFWLTVCINLKCININCNATSTLFSSQFRLHVTWHWHLGRSWSGSTLFSKEELINFTKHYVGFSSVTLVSLNNLISCSIPILTRNSHVHLGWMENIVDPDEQTKILLFLFSRTRWVNHQLIKSATVCAYMYLYVSLGNVQLKKTNENKDSNNHQGHLVLIFDPFRTNFSTEFRKSTNCPSTKKREQFIPPNFYLKFY